MLYSKLAVEVLGTQDQQGMEPLYSSRRRSTTVKPRCLRRLRCVSRQVFSSSTPDRGANKRLRRNSQHVMQAPYHREGQRAFAVEHLRDATFAPEHTRQVVAGEAPLLHPYFNRLDGIRGINPPLLLLVCFHEG